MGLLGGDGPYDGPTYSELMEQDKKIRALKERISELESFVLRVALVKATQPRGILLDELALVVMKARSLMPDKDTLKEPLCPHCGGTKIAKGTPGSGFIWYRCYHCDAPKEGEKQ